MAASSAASARRLDGPKLHLTTECPEDAATEQHRTESTTVSIQVKHTSRKFPHAQLAIGLTPYGQPRTANACRAALHPARASIYDSISRRARHRRASELRHRTSHTAASRVAQGFQGTSRAWISNLRIGRTPGSSKKEPVGTKRPAIVDPRSNYAQLQDFCGCSELPREPKSHLKDQSSKRDELGWESL